MAPEREGHKGVLHVTATTSFSDSEAAQPLGTCSPAPLPPGMGLPGLVVEGLVQAVTVLRPRVLKTLIYQPPSYPSTQRSSCRSWEAEERRTVYSSPS